MPDLLHLPHLRCLEVDDHEDHYRIIAAGNVEPTACPESRCRSGLYRHGSQAQTYIDTPMHGKRVILEIDRKRYRCKGCGKTLLEPLPDMDAKRNMTERLVKFIEQHCLKETFAALSRQVGIDDKTIRHVFDDYVEAKKREVHFSTPKVLGIDELKIVGEYRCMLTNIEKLTVFDLLPSRKKSELTAHVKSLPDKENVEVVVMDMWAIYKQVVQAELPGRLIVADKWHVCRMANEAVERVRKAIRKGLDTRTRLKLKDERFVLLKRRKSLSPSDQEKLNKWGTLFPALLTAYEAKERFFDLYGHASREDAEAAAEAWEKQLDNDILWAFKDVRRALKNWWNEIFNYYGTSVTNAYTESINRLAKDINRMGRGYSFEVVRARLLYDEKPRKKTRETLRKKVRKEVTSNFFTRAVPTTIPQAKTYETVIQESVVEYGAHIPTLCDLLESGYFD
ncbi:MAG TPA: ISL3 family transposase [Burkholderiales bacterium]|nr:ISL3 family transposase [Burkholderiales bacterium]